MNYNSQLSTKHIPIRDLPNHIPRNRGRKVHIATVYRWMNRGVRGIRLETLLIGGRRYVTEESLERFVSLVSSQTTAGPTQKVVTEQRQREIAGAQKLCDAAGI